MDFYQLIIASMNSS